MTRGGRICFFKSLRNSRLAACLSRRRWTRTSSTIPVWSTAPPQPVLRTGDLEHHLVQMPFVANSRQAATDLVGERLAEFARPLPHRFVANDDAASRQQLLNHTQPEREPEIQPDGVADNLRGEPISDIAGASRLLPPPRLPTAVRFRKRAGR